LAETRGLLAPRILAQLVVLSLVGHLCSVAAIPLSIGGWGIREAGMVVGLLAFGVAEGSALALSVAFGMTQVALGVVGVPIYLLARTDKYKPMVDRAS
jgi:hypothetical protein